MVEITPSETTPARTQLMIVRDNNLIPKWIDHQDSGEPRR